MPVKSDDELEHMSEQACGVSSVVNVLCCNHEIGTASQEYEPCNHIKRTSHTKEHQS